MSPKSGIDQGHPQDHRVQRVLKRKAKGSPDGKQVTNATLQDRNGRCKYTIIILKFTDEVNAMKESRKQIY